MINTEMYLKCDLVISKYHELSISKESYIYYLIKLKITGLFANMKALLLSIYRVLGSLSNAFFYIILFCGTNTILTERKFGTDKFAQGYRAGKC